MNEESFSQRHGFSADAAEITIRNDAPQEIRGGLLMIANGELNLSPSAIREILCTLLRKVPDADNWTPYPNIWNECQYLLEQAPWNKVYDFVEALYRHLSRPPASRARKWESLINDYFVESGVGWRLVNGQLESRGPEAFELAVDNARSALESAELPTAKQEIHEALHDLSRRPDPDLTGAVQHAMAALECTARATVGDPRATLGEILKRYPNAIPKPLDDSLSKMWGYASEVARHIREGRTPSRAEAELVVGVAAAASSYLSARLVME